MRPLALLSLLLIASWLCMSERAHAQEQPLQAANGAAIYLGALEGTFALEIPVGLALALSSSTTFEQAVGCAVLLPLCAFTTQDSSAFGDMLAGIAMLVVGGGVLLVVPPIFGGVEGASGWDVDGSLVLTSGVHGLVSGGLLGAGLGSLGDSPELGTVLGGVLGAAGSITYSALRLDMLAREPRVGVEANLLMWGPPVAMMLAGLFAAIAEMDGTAAMILGGLVGLLAQGVAITLTEVAIANP